MYPVVRLQVLLIRKRASQSGARLSRGSTGRVGAGSKRCSKIGGTKLPACSVITHTSARREDSNVVKVNPVTATVIPLARKYSASAVT